MKTPFLLSVALGFLATVAVVSAQSGFRVRLDFSAPLNSDQGWAGPLNADAPVLADQPFRLRFELDAPATATFGLQVRRNDEAWTHVEAHDFPHPESANAKTPRVSIVACRAYTHAEPTTDLLSGSRLAFSPGAGVSLAERVPVALATSTHTEIEFPLVVRRFADGAVTNEAGDLFQFRLVDATGAPLPATRLPTLRLAIPPGHVGGTFVETPGRIGPWRATNGDLYFIMEPAETSNLFMMIKSSDDGRTWREIDGANRPPTRDLESVDTRQIGSTIHVLHQVTRSSRYHSFRTSDHPTHPDTWEIRGEQAGTATAVAQAAALVVRSDASLVAFYVGQTKIHTSIRSPAGVWREAGVIDSAVGPQAVLGARDTVHLAYYRPDGTLWYRRLDFDGTFSTPEPLAAGLRTTRAEFGSVLPLLYIPSSDTVVLLYRLATGLLWERRSVKHGPLSAPRQVTDRAVIQNAVDSQQPAADAVLDGETVHVLFVAQSTRSLYSTHDAGGWQPSTLRVDRIQGSWVRGNIYARRDGTKVYGYIYDAGSDGGAGMNRFGDFPIPVSR